MAHDVTLRDEYEMLTSELRQNRQIQLQTFAMTPVWFGLFFGLLASGGRWSSEQAALILVPVPLVLINLFLILDRRSSSDIIVAYLRTAVDRRLADRPGWNHLLPTFRRELKTALRAKTVPSIPQRFDFNVIVWSSFLAISLICCALFWSAAPQSVDMTIGAVGSVLAAYLVMLYRIVRQAAIKDSLLAAWESTLRARQSGEECLPAQHL